MNKLKLLFLLMLFCSCKQTRFEKLNDALLDYTEQIDLGYKIQVRKIKKLQDTTAITYNIRVYPPASISEQSFFKTKDSSIYLQQKKPLYPLFNEIVANGNSNCVEYLCAFSTQDLYDLSTPMMIYQNWGSKKAKIAIKLIQ